MGNVIVASTPKSSKPKKGSAGRVYRIVNDINSECCECFLNLPKYQNQAGRLPSPGTAFSQAF